MTKLCVCGHAMEDRGAQTLEMNGSSLGSNLWTDHVEVDMYICPWCGRMAFFEPEAIRKRRFSDACEGKTIEELRALLYDSNPELLQDAAREHIEELEADARYRAEQEREEAESAQSAKVLSNLLGKDGGDDDKRRRTARRSFDEFIVKVRTVCALFA